MWYIGQEIVAIVNHSQGFFKEGDTFPVKGLRNAICSCDYIEIDIGIQSNLFRTSICTRCNFRAYKTDSVCWFYEGCFAPLDFDISELTEILEQEILQPK